MLIVLKCFKKLIRIILSIDQWREGAHFQNWNWVAQDCLMRWRQPAVTWCRAATQHTLLGTNIVQLWEKEGARKNVMCMVIKLCLHDQETKLFVVNITAACAFTLISSVCTIWTWWTQLSCIYLISSSKFLANFPLSLSSLLVCSLFPAPFPFPTLQLRQELPVSLVHHYPRRCHCCSGVRLQVRGREYQQPEVQSSKALAS